MVRTAPTRREMAAWRPDNLDSESMRRLVHKALAVAGTALLSACSSHADRDHDLKQAIAAACEHKVVHVSKEIEVSDLYVDRPYLRILLKPHDESYGLNDLVEFLFETRLDAIETTNTDANGNALVAPFPGGANGQYIRVSIKPLGDPACRAYQYPTRYPGSAMPWLRRLGLRDGSCVGIESSSSVRSKTSIQASEQLIGKQHDGNSWQKRIDVELRDVSGPMPEVAASMVDVYASAGGGKVGRRYDFVCDTGDRQVEAFRHAFRARGNPDISPPPRVDLPPYAVAASYPMVDDRWLGTLRWSSRPGSAWSGQINDEGTVWTAQKTTNHRPGYTFNSLFEGKLFSSPVLVPQGVRDITGLARTPKGYAIVSSEILRSNSPRHILEFDVRGRILAIFALSDSQYKGLTGIADNASR
jgi:hypothetical protein